VTADSSDISHIKAMVFDVFGTVVDWRTSLINDFTRWGGERDLEIDWAGLVDDWRAAYMPSMDVIRKQPAKDFVALDTLHRQSLEVLAPRYGLGAASEPELRYLTTGWHRLLPWPDSVSGLTALKRRYIIAPLSNGNVSLLTNMAKHAGIPWDLVLSAEIFNHYKPDPEVYLGAAKILGLKPEEVMMVAAHNNDLAAAKALGLATAFVPRIAEYGPHQKRDFKPEGDWTIVAQDFNDLAKQMGC
jgi:2-haloacid dehalogenase